MTDLAVRVSPADWPLGAKLVPLVEAAVARLDLGGRLGEVAVVMDALAADDHAWFTLTSPSPCRLTLWLHADQVLRDRPRPAWDHGVGDQWRLGPAPAPTPLTTEDFSPLNAQRVLYQQLLLVRDLLDGLLAPRAVPPPLVEALQAAWLVTVDGRLRRLGLPHLSAAERRLRFLHLFAPAGVLRPSHWAIFNRLWELDEPQQDVVLALAGALPPLLRRPRL